MSMSFNMGNCSNLIPLDSISLKRLSGSGSGSSSSSEVATSTSFGGIKADIRTTENMECKIDEVNGKLYTEIENNSLNVNQFSTGLQDIMLTYEEI